MKKTFERLLFVGVFAFVYVISAVSQGIEKPEMIKIPGKNYEMSRTEVTQKLYESVMELNPSNFKGENHPVEVASWLDGIYFCNKLSEKYGYAPVYAVNGETDTNKWNYIPHKRKLISGTITQNKDANGYRLPTVEEWQYAARGGENYKYDGISNADEIGWRYNNSGKTTHPVAEKKPNGYGLYDMFGNVAEWCWDSYGYGRCNCGGDFFSDPKYSFVFDSFSYNHS